MRAEAARQALRYCCRPRTRWHSGPRRARLRDHLLARPDLSPADVGFSAATTEPVLEERAVGHRRRAGTSLLAGLAALAADQPAAGVVTGSAAPGRTGVPVLRPGVAAAGDGPELAAAFPVFAAALDEVVRRTWTRCSAVRCAICWPRRSAEAALLDRTRFTQPALFAVEVALFRLVGVRGRAPGLPAGHSVGEIAAAHVAGVLSLADACALVAARGRLMRRAAGRRGDGRRRGRRGRGQPRRWPGTTAGSAVAAVNGPGASWSPVTRMRWRSGCRAGRSGRRYRRLRVSTPSTPRGWTRCWRSSGGSPRG